MVYIFSVGENDESFMIKFIDDSPMLVQYIENHI